ncbi:MAG TPA: hypothetical protein VMY39_07320 [Planctomycetota bacterium]|nr:hypothetical protein [Planctomycetota bacterium]
MQTRARRITVVTAIIVVSLTLVLMIGHRMIVHVAMQDVVRELQASSDVSIEVSYVACHPSAHHLVTLDFEIQGHWGFSRAVWYLVPWREVIAEK